MPVEQEITSSAIESATTPPRLVTGSFLLLCLFNLLIFTVVGLLLTALPPYVMKLGGTAFDVGWIVGVFTLASALGAIPIGRAADHYGKRPVLLIGAALFFGAALCYLFVATIGWLIVLRIIHGLGWQAVATTGMALAADLIPLKRRGEGLAYIGTAGVGAFAFAPALGDWLAQSSFERLFLVHAAIAGAALLLLAGLKKGRGNAVALALRPAAVERGALLPALFLMALSFGYGGIFSLLPTYAASYGVANPGVFFTIYVGLLILFRPILGWLSDRIGRSLVILPCILFTLAGYAVLATSASLSYLIAAAILFGLGFGALPSLVAALVVDRVAPASRSAALATVNALFDTGIGGGSIILGVALSWLTYQGTFWLTVAVGSGALVLLALDWRLARA